MSPSLCALLSGPARNLLCHRRPPGRITVSKLYHLTAVLSRSNCTTDDLEAVLPVRCTACQLNAVLQGQSGTVNHLDGKLSREPEQLEPNIQIVSAFTLLNSDVSVRVVLLCNLLSQVGRLLSSSRQFAKPILQISLSITH